jgi:DNA-binding protein YbaB
VSEAGDRQAGRRDGEAHGVGTADEGRVRAVVAATRMISLEPDPRVLRHDPETLAEHLRTAVNAAFEDLRTAAAADGEAPVIDPLAMARQFRALSDDLDHRMTAVTGSIQESATALRRDAEVPGELPTMEFGDLFGQLADLLEIIGGVPDGEPPLGEGTVTGGWVRVTCEPGPRVVSMTVQRRAMRGTAELAGHVEAAVNAALEDLAEKTRELRKEAGADPEKINARIGELRELGVTRMEAYGQAVSGLMGGIRPYQ